MTQLKLLKGTQDDLETKEAEKRSAISELFEMARRGEIPRARQLLAHEPIQLNERHLQAIMMRIMGMRQCDIAKALDYTDSTVSIVLNHPDAAYILDRLQAMSAVEVTDIDARLQRLNAKAVDSIEDLFDATDFKEAQLHALKARAGFSLLERNLGKKKEVKHAHEHRFMIDQGAASLLSRGLQEARQVEDGNFEYRQLTPVGGMGQDPGLVPMLPSDTSPPPVGAPQEFVDA